MHAVMHTQSEHSAHTFYASYVLLSFSHTPHPLGTSRKEITEHWEWLENNLLQTLSIFENENDITTFVKGKVQVYSHNSSELYAQLLLGPVPYVSCSWAK